MIENLDEQFEDIAPGNRAQEVYNVAPASINVTKYQASSNLKVIVMLVLVMVGLLGVVGFLGYQKFVASKAQSGEALSDDMQVLASNNPAQIADYFYKKATGKSTVDTSDVVKTEAGVQPVANVTPTQKTTTLDVDITASAEAGDVEQKKVAVKISSGGRIDPFMPYIEKNLVMFNPDFDIVAPPEELNVNQSVTEMMSATVSGIMYQKGGASSAIVNINGSDQLVRIGDKVDGQSIIDITRDRVVMKQGSNIYRVAVGQSVETTGVTYNNVSNLNRKFGGAVAPRKSGVIEINVSDVGSTGAMQKSTKSGGAMGGMSNPGSAMPQIPTL